MRKYIHAIVNHPLISGSTILFIGGFAVNILGYFFNLLMGRMLSVENYGLLAALTSLLVLFGIFQSSFVGIFAKFSAKYAVQHDENSFGQLLSYGSKFILVFSGILLVILIGLTPIIDQSIKVGDIRLLILIFLAVAVSIVYALPLGILKGEMEFTMISILNLINPVLKIALGVLFVLMGMQVFGIMVGIFIAAFMPVIIGFWIVLNRHKKKPLHTKVAPDMITAFRSYSLKFFLATIGLTVISNADIILVRVFFEPTISGQYAALSLMGKAIFYLTMPIFTVFFSLMAQKTEKNEEVVKTLLLTIGIVTSISIALSFIYFIFPYTVLAVFFPAPEYKVLAPLLGPFALYIVVFSLVNLFNNYFLSTGKTNIYKMNLIFAFVFLFSIFVFHNSLYQVIGVLFGVSLLLLISYLLYYKYSNGKD